MISCTGTCTYMDTYLNIAVCSIAVIFLTCAWLTDTSRYSVVALSNWHLPFFILSVMSQHSTGRARPDRNRVPVTELQVAAVCVAPLLVDVINSVNSDDVILVSSEKLMTFLTFIYGTTCTVHALKDYECFFTRSNRVFLICSRIRFESEAERGFRWRAVDKFVTKQDPTLQSC